MARQGTTLSALVQHGEQMPQVRKADLQAGDMIRVRTLNSVYRIYAAGEGMFVVSGGWFDRKGLTPMKTTITGCTWGGSVIKVDVVAVQGLCLEFGNRLITSTIRGFVVMPHGSQN